MQMIFPSIRSVRLKAATAWAGNAPGADAVRAGLTCEPGRRRTDHAARAEHEGARSLSDTGAKETIRLAVRSLLWDI
jgi:hypothetical protein